MEGMISVTLNILYCTKAVRRDEPRELDFNSLLMVDDLHNVTRSFRYLLDAGREHAIVEGRRDVGRCLACEGNLMSRCGSDLSLGCEPSIDTMLESAPSAVIGNRLTIG